MFDLIFGLMFDLMFSISEWFWGRFRFESLDKAWLCFGQLAGHTANRFVHPPIEILTLRCIFQLKKPLQGAFPN